MDIAFANPQLRMLCTTASGLRSRLGDEAARELRAHLATLRAAESLEDLRNLPGRCGELDGQRSGQLALRLAAGHQLVFEPTHGGSPGGHQMVWSEITAIRIVEIVDR
jgi:proteic killer suppression protein